jgi:cell division protein FtsL
MSNAETIREINYQIKRLEMDVKNLERTIETKRRNRFLDSATELDLKEKISDKKAEIAGLQSEIRKLENEAARASNMEDDVDIEIKKKKGLFD